MDEHIINRLKAAVKSAGADWCGIQETIPPLPSLLLFNSPKSGSTLAVRFYPSNFDSASIAAAVRRKMKESDKKFKVETIRVPVAALDELASSLLSLTKILYALCPAKFQEEIKK